VKGGEGREEIEELMALHTIEVNPDQHRTTAEAAPPSRLDHQGRRTPPDAGQRRTAGVARVSLDNRYYWSLMTRRATGPSGPRGPTGLMTDRWRPDHPDATVPTGPTGPTWPTGPTVPTGPQTGVDRPSGRDRTGALSSKVMEGRSHPPERCQHRYLRLQLNRRGFARRQ